MGKYPFTKERPLWLKESKLLYLDERGYGVREYLDVDTEERKQWAKKIFKMRSRIDEFFFEVFGREVFGIAKPDIYVYRFLGQNISRAKNRGEKSWPNDLHPIDVYLVGEKQERKCNITGEPMEFERGGEYWQNKWCNPWSCVIDRIDPMEGYTIDNIQLLTHKANTWKSNFTHEELLWLSKEFVKRAKKLVKS